MLKKVLEKFSLSTESRNRLLNGCIESPEWTFSGSTEE